MTTNTNTKLIWAIVALLVVGGVIYISLPAKNTSQQTAQSNQSPSLTLQGTVTGVNAEKSQVLFEASADTPSKATNLLKIAYVSPATKIERVISQKNAKGIIEKQVMTEVNIDDVQKGSKVTVMYQSEKEGTLIGVSQITFTVEGNVDAYLKAQAVNQTVYIKTKVATIDIAGRNLTYIPYILNTLASTTITAAIPNDVAVYRVDDPARVSITHARTAATLADIRPGQTVFIVADPTALKANKVVPQTIIISGK